MKKVINIGIVGFGTVGSGVVEVLNNDTSRISQKVGAKIQIKRIVDKDIVTPRHIKIDQSLLTTDINKILDDPEIDIVVELIGQEDVAQKIILSAMERGKHIVTANKALLAKEWNGIFEASKRYGCEVLFEASVGGGIPIIQCIRQSLTSNRILSVFGIINGTCNYILSKMRSEKKDFSVVLKEAKESGFAEPCPTLDIEGIDASHKLVALANLAFSKRVRIEDIYTEGITHITKRDIVYAEEEFGYIIKLLGIAKRIDNELELRVHPTMIPKGHLLASVSGEYNAIYIIGDLTGPLMFYGKGAGRAPTTSAVIADIIHLAKKIANGVAGYIEESYYEKPDIKPMDEFSGKYYIRFEALDQPGVLASISGILGEHNISISSVIQKERRIGDIVPIVMLTHEAKERNIKRALKKIDKLPVVKAKSLLVRVEELTE